jgi:hypothetical protein
MTRIWRQIQRSLSTRRRHRLLADALRSVPEPVARDGLRDRLVNDALAAAARTPSQPSRSRPPGLAGAAAIALAVLAITWVAWWGLAHRDRAAGVPPGHRIAPAGPVAATPHERGEQQPPDAVSAPTAEREAASAAATRHTRGRKQDTLVPDHTAETPRDDGGGTAPEEAPVIVVSVSRVPLSERSYARAAAWSGDIPGRSVRTECTISRDPRARVSTRSLSMTDESGQLCTLTVMASNSDEEPNGERR